MGYLTFNADEEISSRLQESRTETVTLLIPEGTLARLGVKDAKVLPKKIPQLLRTYGKYLTATKRLGKKAGKTLYQPSPGKEKMKRVNVRLSTGSWTFLGTLAQAHGVSRCYLFNYLLWLEELEVGDSIVETVNAGAPAFHRYYSYILHLDLPNNRVFRRLQTEPVSLFYVLDYRDWFPS
ncbi:CopG family transcriptional regulator [Leptospira tipperaryensis]|uniref:CopG family transcriptional regulator n=1 Tax=Leptospira tipperaryensis TaxID=2564040 RepID=A0A1D7V250_9LEPT|nr:DUF1564 domain-containing protein [Leptospira tipperaryensis]AOP35909.1 CopG family transcriptional regulator [Leptospira tipperaryensis]